MLADGTGEPEPAGAVEACGDGQAGCFFKLFLPHLGVIRFGRIMPGVVMRENTACEQASGEQCGEAFYHLAWIPTVRVRGRPGAKVSNPEVTLVLSA